MKWKFWKNLKKGKKMKTDEIIDYLIDNHKEAYIDDCLCERDNAHNMTFYEWAEQLVDLEGSDYILNEYNFKRKERG